jgi:insulysin
MASFTGIAHLTEHIMFLGTKKFPVENEYDRYLAAAGGHSNAYTDLELTCYYMDCQPSALEGALDRFASCLVEPAVNVASLEKEIQAVDSEHAKNVQNDHWRSMQLSKTAMCGKCTCDTCSIGEDVGNGIKTQRSCHPYAGFGSGNLETLLPQSIGAVVADADVGDVGG